jgi:copper(I)-binding protein
MKRLFLLTAVAALALASCGGGSQVSIDDPWARTSASTQNAGAGYFTITGGDTADRLLSVSVDASIAAVAEIHESSMDPETSMMSMQAVESLEIPAGGTVILEPGSYHVMLMMLTEELVAGTEFDLDLTFEDAGVVTVTLEVRDE